MLLHLSPVAAGQKNSANSVLDIFTTRHLSPSLNKSDSASELEENLHLIRDTKEDVSSNNAIANNSKCPSNVIRRSEKQNNEAMYAPS